MDARGGGDLLEQRATGHCRDTPLHLAALNAKPIVTRTLIDLGADTAARQSARMTLLQLAVQDEGNVD